MFCSGCGKEIAENSNMCPNCGKSLVKENKKTVKVVWHRKKTMVCALMPLQIFVDGNQVANLKNDETCETEILCGEHEIILDMKTALNKLKFNFSDEYSKIYLDVKAKMGFVSGKVEIVSVKNEK